MLIRSTGVTIGRSRRLQLQELLAATSISTSVDRPTATAIESDVMLLPFSARRLAAGHIDAISRLPGINRARIFDTSRSSRFQCSERANSERLLRALSDADDLIAALERLIAKKQAIKQGMMQQLLTGQTRLPGFDDAWSDASLAMLAVILSSAGSLDLQLQRCGHRRVAYPY